MVQHRRHLPLTLVVLLFLAACFAQAAFTRPALWKLDSIDKTYAGTWCFHPGPNPTFRSTCANATLSALLKTHLHNDLGPGLSIAYYDFKDGSVLGGADWTFWDVAALPVGLCTSGRVDGLDKVFSTTCRFAVTDNDHDTPSVHAEECTSNHSQLRVTDGCYSPPPHRSWLRLGDSASGILTIIGLILALPLLGIYRWYRTSRARQKATIGGEQRLPLVGLGVGPNDTGAASASPEASHPELLRAEIDIRANSRTT